MTNYERRMAAIDICKPPAKRGSSARVNGKYNGIYTYKPKYCHTYSINPWHHSENCSIGCPCHKSKTKMKDNIGGDTTNHIKKKE